MDIKKAKNKYKGLFREDKVIELFEENRDSEVFSVNEIKERLGFDYGQKSLYNKLESMVKDGKIERIQFEGNGKVYYQLPEVIESIKNGD